MKETKGHYIKDKKSKVRRGPEVRKVKAMTSEFKQRRLFEVFPSHSLSQPPFQES